VSRPKPKRRRRRLPAPLCAQCGCTEQRACPGGCAWDPVELARGRYVCTRCTGRHALAELA